MNKIIRLDSVDSTNEYLKNKIKEKVPSGTCVIAKYQTNGKGCYDRVFQSPEGGLYLSYLIKVETTPEQTIEITKWVAICVYESIKELLNIDIKIKYINDILLNGKKICGILVELVNNYLIIGIGINCNTNINLFPKEIKSIATSIKEETGINVITSDLENKLIDKLNEMANKWPSDKTYIKKYNDVVIR